MADIDLKTETPDTTLPTTGFLFGADSQAAASPSVFTVQSVATTLLGSTTLTGETVTTSSPVIDAAQTWDDGGVTFTGLKFNATDTASAAASLLMDLQVGGASAFNVSKAGSLKLGINSSGTNVAGTNVVVAGSQGTGTGAGGSIVFQVAPAGLAGTNVNALADSIAIQPGAIQLRFGQLIGNGGGLGGSYNGLTWYSNGTPKFTLSSNGALTLVSDAALQFRSATTTSSGSVDVTLFRDAADTLALGRGANAQAFRVYNTFTNATDNFERANIFWGSNVLKIGTEKGSVGGTARALELQTDGTTRLTIAATTGNVTTTGSVTTEAPTGGTAAAWRLGTVASVTPTLQNRTIEVDIGGTIYYISAKTTND
jgi:hypothetical protein